MWNKIKSFFLIGVFFFSFLLLENQNTLGIIKAADLQKNTNASEELNIQIIAYDAETDMGLAVICTGNATVIGDGFKTVSTGRARIGSRQPHSQLQTILKKR